MRRIGGAQRVWGLWSRERLRLPSLLCSLPFGVCIPRGTALPVLGVGVSSRDTAPPFLPVPQVLIPGCSPLLPSLAGSTGAAPAPEGPAAMSTFRQESVEDFYEMGEELGR